MNNKPIHDRTEITFLGTGDSMGVPRMYCGCEVCEESRNGGMNRRLRSSIWLRSGEEELLVDCGPDWRMQMEKRGTRNVMNVLITHAHFDHIGGLPELADACRWTGRKIELFAPSEVIDTISRQFPWLGNQLLLTSIDEGFSWSGWTVTPFRVCHGKNGFSYAYRFENDASAWVYCPDSINLQEHEKARMRNVRLLILGTSFYKEEAEFHTRSVYDMTEAELLVQELRPQEVYYTHMSHDIDRRKSYPLSEGIRFAVEGTVIEL